MMEERAVKVPFRRAEENVVYWVEQIMGFAIYLDHRMFSPNCKEAKMEYAKLPAPENAPFIGGKPEVN